MLLVPSKFLFEDSFDIPHQFRCGIDLHQDCSCRMAYIRRDVRSRSREYQNLRLGRDVFDNLERRRARHLACLIIQNDSINFASQAILRIYREQGRAFQSFPLRSKAGMDIL